MLQDCLQCTNYNFVAACQSMGHRDQVATFDLLLKMSWTPGHVQATSFVSVTGSDRLALPGRHVPVRRASTELNSDVGIIRTVKIYRAGQLASPSP